MSQRDLVAELQAARVEAPPHLRSRVRLIAVTDTTPRSRRLTWRRALVVAVPVAAAIAAGLFFTRPSPKHEAVPPLPRARPHAAATPSALAPAGGRALGYDATLSLQLPTPKAVSDGVKRALRIAARLGGSATSVHASSQAQQASASLVLRLPRAHVQAALTQLVRLGTITAERAAVTRPKGGDATVGVQLATPPRGANHGTGHGPLHGVGVASKWLGIGALYALAVGGPVAVLLVAAYLVLCRVRHRREDELLSRS
jgi:hypothetical protein